MRGEQEFTCKKDMKYKYKEIKNSLTKKKNSRSSIWVRLWVRKASFPVTYMFINTGWTANMVSLFSGIIIIIGSVLLAINNFWLMFVGIVLINFWLVLDCVDGNIARVKKQRSFMGDFFDAIVGYIPFSLTTLAIGIAAYNTSTLIPNNYRTIYIIIGGLSGIANLHMRLIHQKYQNMELIGKNKILEYDTKPEEKNEDKKSFSYISERIDKNLGVSGIFMPWLFISLFTNTFDIMIIFYSLYYLASFAMISLLYMVKAIKFESYAQEKRRILEEQNDKQ